MGWTFFADYRPHETRADIIRREFTQAATDENPWAFGFEYIATRGATVYAVMWKENKRDNVPRYYFGAVFLTQRKNGEFGYKDMDETMGPCAHGAPLKLVKLLDELAPGVEGYAAKWRQSIRDYHAAKKTRPSWAPGARIRLYGHEYILSGPRKSLFTGRAAGWHATGINGGAYRISAQQMARAELVEG